MSAHVRALGLGVLVGAIAASPMGYLFRPMDALAQESPAVLVGEWCPYSQAALASAERHPEVAAATPPIPVGDSSREFRQRACAATTPELRRRAWRFHLVPDGWLCDQLWRAGTRHWLDSAGSVPEYLQAGYPLDRAELDAYLEPLALRKRDGVVLPSTLADQLDADPPPPREPDRTAVVYGYDIDF